VHPLDWKELTQNERRPLLNRSLQGVYPPGSTYKVITALAGLERGVITPDFRVHCGGSFRLGRRTYRCWKKEGHGEMDLHRAMVRSCDVFFYRVGHALKPSDRLPAVNVLAQFARMLGLGAPTQLGIDHEAGGLVPTAEWKEKVFREPWMDGETISLAIGQGANQWTPIQMANLYATIGNGGTRYRPQIIRRVIDAEGNVISRFEPKVVERIADSKSEGISQRSFEIVREALRGVVHDARGTAYYAMQGLPKDITVAGKTGTAQVINMPAEPVPEEELPEQYRDHAWFVAFTPVDTPRLAVAVLVENGGHGGSAAAPIAKKLIEAFYKNEALDAQPVFGPNPAPPSSAPARTPVPIAEQARVVPAAPVEGAPVGRN
jgi:penicillin-binding protein 2